MKRILIFSTDDHLVPAGGAEQAFGNITKRMPEMEFDLICAKLRKGALAYEKVGNVNIYRMGFGIAKVDGIILALFGQYCAYKLIKKYEYDLLWSIMASYGAFAAVRVKRRTGVPLLLTLQEGDSFEYIYNKVRFVRNAFNNIFKSADAIQAISHYLLHWGKSMGYKGALGRVIPNGVDISAYTRVFDAQKVLEKRASFGFPSDAFILFSTSRLEKKNGHRDIIQSLPLLPEKVCFINWHVGSLRDELTELAKELDVSHRVKLAPAVDPKELPLLVQAGDVFIRPSLSEGLGNSFLEAMAARKIIIGTAVGGIPDFLVDNQTGFFADVENSESVAQVVDTVMKLNTHEKEKVLDQAELLVREKYDWDIVTKDMRSLFKDIAETT